MGLFLFFAPFACILPGVIELFVLADGLVFYTFEEEHTLPDPIKWR
jgi:hypothetical protein